MDSRRFAYLKALDIDVWERRDLDPGVVAPATVETVPSASPETGGEPNVTQGLDWTALERAVRTCTLCPLHASRTQGVFGVGNRQARWMIIGEAPGAEEDRQGEPFVGRAGQLLNSMLKAIGLSREEVFIANILKSRPPNNRDPRPEEVRACIPYLFRQIELVNPRLLLCVGRIAAQTLLDTDTTIGKLRGRVHHIVSGRPMIVTYHPAYLLRSPVEKRKVWTDLVLAMNTFERLGAEAQAIVSAEIDRAKLFRNVRFRPMALTDVPAVVAVERASYLFPWSEGVFRDCIRVGYLCRVVEAANEVAGYGIMSQGAGEAHILNICIRDDLRSGGIGRRLMMLLLERARAAAMQYVFLEVRPSNPVAIRLYESLGFARVGVRKGYYQATGGREDAWVYKLTLSGGAGGA